MRAGIAILALALAGCGRDPADTPESAKAPAPATPLDRAASARGGWPALRRISVTSLHGTLRFAGSDPITVSAFVDVRGGVRLGFVDFTQDNAYRALLLHGADARERSEGRAEFAPIVGRDADELRAIVTALQVATRFPLDGPWESVEEDAFTDPEGTRVRIDPEGRAAGVEPLAMKGLRYELLDHARFGDYVVPRRIRALDGGREIWVLEIARHDAHARVRSDFFDGRALEGTTRRHRVPLDPSRDDR